MRILTIIVVASTCALLLYQSVALHKARSEINTLKDPTQVCIHESSWVELIESKEEFENMFILVRRNLVESSRKYKGRIAVLKDRLSLCVSALDNETVKLLVTNKL